MTTNCALVGKDVLFNDQLGEINDELLRLTMKGFPWRVALVLLLLTFSGNTEDLKSVRANIQSDVKAYGEEYG